MDEPIDVILDMQNQKPSAKMLERCDLSDLYKSDCAHCRGIKSAEEEAEWQQRALDSFTKSME